MAKDVVCLGCGALHESSADCEVCYARLVRCLEVFVHWPLEVSISPAALAEVELAIRNHLNREGGLSSRVEAELSNMVNIMRSYLQQVAAGLKAYKDPPRKAEPTDEDLLS